LLRPGQQAQVGAQGQSSSRVQLVPNVNLSAVTAWRNGSFNFDGKTLPEILRQLSRWYDVNVVYQGPVRKVNIAGAMGMDLNLSQVLKVLQKTGVSARIEGKNLIILP
jgi:ferric-dicitrate binding protein FerR (iron transport regulator)